MTNASYVNNLIAEKRIAEIMAAAGIVSTQATTIFSVTPQRTADKRFADPPPEMAPVMRCVVDTGTPIEVAKKILDAAAVSAQKPSIGVNRVIFCPIVLVIRQPPLIVPNAIAA